MRIALALVAGALTVGALGCNSNYDPKAQAEKDKVDAAWLGKIKPTYAEVKGADGKFYVTGTAAGATAAAAGKRPASYKSAIGFGPNKETVIFEENKDGTMADYLMQEFKSKHAPSM